MTNSTAVVTECELKYRRVRNFCLAKAEKILGEVQNSGIKDIFLGMQKRLQNNLKVMLECKDLHNFFSCSVLEA